MKKKRILVVATSRKTRGGITAVIKAHEQGAQWDKYQIKWIETHIDRNLFFRLAYFIGSWIQFFFLLPFYDLVHIYVATFSSLFRKSFYMALAKLYGKKTITHLHCFPEALYERKNRKLYHWLFKSSDLILVLSKSWEFYMEDALGIKDNIRVLYNPIISKPLKDGLSVKKENWVLFAATVIKPKGYHDLIRAFQPVVLKHPDWKLVLAGNGEIEEGKQLAESLDISSSVIFRGWVSGKEKDELFRASSIFCLPSYAEGFPMSVLDAWGYGLPVICTSVGGIPDVTEDGNNVLLFSPGDVAKLSDQLDRLISDEVLREKIIEGSRILAESVFNLDKINQQLESIYKELLGE